MSQQVVELSKLAIDPKANVRASAKPGHEPQFAASIRAKGILEPLIVRPNGGEKYLVVNGGKRLSALQFLKDKGETAAGVPVTADYEVPISVRAENDADARETSLMTNIIRADMHPVEVYRAFDDMVRGGKKAKDIGLQYAMTTKQVDQSLALGRLSDKILDAWLANDIDADVAQAFTLCPDKKSQESIFAKLSKSEDRIAGSDVKDLLKIGYENPGRLVNAVGVEAYEKRGGKVTKDLFGPDHIVSNAKLAKAMSIELVEAKCKELVANGWAFAESLDAVTASYNYGRIQVSSPATEDEQKRLDELSTIAENWDRPEDERDKAEDEAERLQAAIDERGYTRDQMSKAGCFVSIDRTGNLKIEYGRVKPEERKKVAAQERAKTKPKTKSKGPAEDPAISSALAHKLSSAATEAAAEAIKADPELALTFTIAALLSNAGDGVCIKHSGRGTRMNEERGQRDISFEATYLRVSKLAQKAQLTLLAELVGLSFDFQTWNNEMRTFEKDGEGYIAGNAIDAKDLNTALRKKFDATEYFNSVPKALCLTAITEAVNADEARKVSGKPKGEIAKFAITNVPKTGWLPPELRCARYDGPKGKAKPAKKKKR